MRSKWGDKRGVLEMHADCAFTQHCCQEVGGQPPVQAVDRNSYVPATRHVAGDEPAATQQQATVSV
jgi:hypothetical protein